MSEFDSTATSQGVYFDKFLAEHYLSRAADGVSRLEVTEEISAIFPSTNSSHGLTRQIPFTNNGGKNLTMESDRKLEINAKRNGAAEEIHDISVESGYFDVRFGNSNIYLHGEQDYTLEYAYRNVILRQYEYNAENKTTETWQELYWDVNGNGWANSFNSVSVNVHLESDLRTKLDGRVACFVGRYGENGSERCNIQTTSDGFKFSATEIEPYETLTYVIGFKDQTFTIAPAPCSYAIPIILGIITIGAAIIAALSIKVHKNYRNKKQYYRDKFIKPEYTPPTGFTVSEMAMNHFTGVRGNPMVATLLELAVDHKIALVEGDKKTWSIKILQDDFKDVELDVLKILLGSKKEFSQGEEFAVKKNANSHSTKFFHDFTKQNRQHLENSGLWIKEKERKSGTGGLILALILWFIGAIVLLFLLDEYEKLTYKYFVGEDFIRLIPIIWLGVLVFGALTVVMAIKYAKYTEKGLDYSRYLDGLKEYIGLAEADRLKMLQSVSGADTSPSGVVKLYEKLLPYASLFGQEKSWIKEMGRYYEMPDVNQPDWYLGAGAFSAQSFSNAMRSMRSTVSSIMIESSGGSSSSGSGFSGGGFSGGGGGGGGGGSW